jgi:hypothetical protein
VGSKTQEIRLKEPEVIDGVVRFKKGRPFEAECFYVVIHGNKKNRAVSIFVILQI